MDPLRDARVRSPSARGRRAAPTEAGEGNWCVGGTFDAFDRVNRPDFRSYRELCPVISQDIGDGSA
ncbi:hypothetical protein GCM10023065_26000 [Microbacterium laevaniformans]|nr:hypothetical protein GCM10017578_25640 [Microbacterium laevaniformans]